MSLKKKRDNHIESPKVCFRFHFPAIVLKNYILHLEIYMCANTLHPPKKLIKNILLFINLSFYSFYWLNSNLSLKTIYCGAYTSLKEAFYH
jgi:hypothetical protein